MEEKVGSFRLNEMYGYHGNILDNYYKTIEQDGPVFVAVAVDNNQKVRVYFESTDNSSICRVFCSAGEVDLYLDYLKQTGVDTQVMRHWETTPEVLSNFLISTGAPHAAKHNRTLTAFATVCNGNISAVLDVFWSNDSRFMV